MIVDKGSGSRVEKQRTMYVGRERGAIPLQRALASAVFVHRHSQSQRSVY